MVDGAYALAGALTGFVVGLTGVGGGALMMPILLLLSVAPATAIATDLWFAVLTKAVAASIHNGSAQIDWIVVKRLWFGSLPMALLVVALVSFGAQVQKVDWLTEAIGVVVLVTALGMLLAPALRLLARERRLDNPSRFKGLQPALTVFAGLVLGLCVALTSVGAGALGSVILLYLYPLRMTPHRLVATDIMHAMPLALVAGLSVCRHGRRAPADQPACWIYSYGCARKLAEPKPQWALDSGVAGCGFAGGRVENIDLTSCPEHLSFR